MIRLDSLKRDVKRKRLCSPRGMWELDYWAIRHILGS